MSHLAEISNLVPDSDALDMLTESMARESSVLAVSVSDGQLHVIIPLDERISYTIDKLQFVLNRNVTYDTADETQISQQLAKYYPRPSDEPESIFDTSLPEVLPPIDEQAEFSFLDLTGQVTHRTIASVSFHLGKKSNVLELSDGTQHRYDRQCVFNIVGWLDAHFPCLGFHKLFIRCSLPSTNMSYDNMLDLAQCAKAALALPSNVSFRIHLDSSDRGMATEDPMQAVACSTSRRLRDDDPCG